MGRIATFDKKGSHFQRFGLKIFVIAAKAAKGQKLGVRDGLLDVVRVGGGKQTITVGVGRLIRNGNGCININRCRNIQERHTGFANFLCEFKNRMETNLEWVPCIVSRFVVQHNQQTN